MKVLSSFIWAMMGSGATTVVSAQWEANDKSAEIFTKSLTYTTNSRLRRAELIQKAFLELVKNKTHNMHESY